LELKNGQAFNPDKRIKKTLEEAAEVGSTVVRTIMSKPRDKNYYLYPNSSWVNPLVNRSYESCRFKKGLE